MVKLTGIIEFMKRTELMDAIVRLISYPITASQRAGHSSHGLATQTTAWPLKPWPGHFATIKKKRQLLFLLQIARCGYLCVCGCACVRACVRACVCVCVCVCVRELTAHLNCHTLPFFKGGSPVILHHPLKKNSSTNKI